MTNEQYFQQLERHLLIAEPKRSEIIRELKRHTTDDLRWLEHLGDPKHLALQYNKTHLGWFHIVGRIIFLPTFVWVCVVLWQMVGGMTGHMSNNWIANPDAVLPFLTTVMPSLVVLGFVLFIAMEMCKALARMEHRIRTIVPTGCAQWLSGFLLFVALFFFTAFRETESTRIASVLLAALLPNIFPALITTIGLCVGTSLYQHFDQGASRKVQTS